jgi:hypothetical protein
MEREIKFRAWDGEKMWDNPTVWYGSVWNAMEDVRVDGCELMQFTGLKDKNGIEIYEGDKISFNYEYVPFRVLSAIVVWDDCMFSVKVSSINQTLPLYGVMDAEVVGNIYK